MKKDDIKNQIVSRVNSFISNRKGGDMGAGTAIAIIAVVVLGFLFINRTYNFFDTSFLPEWYNGMLDMFHMGR
jgi:hypothetical protein